VTRIGADLVVETLTALGADTVFGEPGQHEVTARVAAIDWRCLALARLYHRPEFKYWSVHGGVITIGTILLEAAATEPLIETGGEPGFDADRFFNRLRLH